MGNYGNSTGACGRAGGGGRAVRRRMDAERRRWVVRSGAPHRTELYEGVGNRLSALCEALGAAGDPTVARLLVAGAWRRMDGQLRRWTTFARAEVRQSQLEILSSLLVSLLGAADDELRNEVTAALREHGDNVVECLIPALRLANARRAAGFDAVARDCGEGLGAIIARPPRDEDDWSITWTGCGCGLCHKLGTFLGSRSQRVFESDRPRYLPGILCRPVVQICVSVVARLSSVSADGPALQIGQSTCT
jgi:hypothetical protein